MSKPAKSTRRKGPAPGPTSKDEAISRIDRRTRAGRLMRTLEADLTSDLGGDPSAAQKLLIKAATVKAVRLALLADQLLDGVEVQSDQHHVLAWANSLRLDLVALGLERRAKAILTSNPLVDHFSRPHQRVEAAE